MGIKISQVVGLPGLSSDERANTKKAAKILNRILIIFGLWLPFQYYLQNTNQISPLVMIIIDWLIWLAILIETVTITILAKHKLLYLFSNWLNLFLIIIAFPLFWSFSHTTFEIFNYLRVVLLFRLFYPAYPLIRKLLARNSLGITLIIVSLFTFLGGIIIAIIDPAMHSPLEGVWFAAQTVSTVGYGNIIPHSLAGKVFSLVLMFMGVGFFSVLSGNLAAYLVQQDREKPHHREKELKEKIDSIEKKLDQLLEEKAKNRD